MKLTPINQPFSIVLPHTIIAIAIIEEEK